MVLSDVMEQVGYSGSLGSFRKAIATGDVELGGFLLFPSAGFNIRTAIYSLGTDQVQSLLLTLCQKQSIIFLL